MIKDAKLTEVLRRDFGLSKEHEELARAWQRDKGSDLAHILVEMRVVTQENMLKALARAVREKRVEETPAHDGSERRVHARRVVPDDFRVFIVDGSERSPAAIKDLSAGGIGIEAQCTFRRDQVLGLELISAKGSKVACAARVCFSRELSADEVGEGKPRSIAGIQFLELSASMKFAIVAILSEAKKRDDELLDIWVG